MQILQCAFMEERLKNRGSELDQEDYQVLPWSFQLVGRRKKGTGGWVRVLDVPPFLRLSEFFFSLEDWFRALEERERLGRKSYGWTKFALGLGETLMASFILMVCFVGGLRFRENEILCLTSSTWKSQHYGSTCKEDALTAGPFYCILCSKA